MERFVGLIVAGGLALVAGLWVVARLAPGSPAWLVGVALAVVGGAGLLWGIRTELAI